MLPANSCPKWAILRRTVIRHNVAQICSPDTDLGDTENVLQLFEPVHCHICGAKWGRSFHSAYVRLGPPSKECRACWNIVPTGEQEWDSLSSYDRRGYFTQVLGYLIPVIPFIILTAIGTYFYAEEAEDAAILTLEYGGIAVLVVLFFGYLFAIRGVVRSKRRTRAAKRAPSASAHPGA